MVICNEQIFFNVWSGLQKKVFGQSKYTFHSLSLKVRWISVPEKSGRTCINQLELKHCTNEK